MGYNTSDVLNLVKDKFSVESVWSRGIQQAHIALVVKRGKVLEIASNDFGTRSNGCGYSARTIHAERAVIKKVGDVSKLAGAVLIVIRIAKGTREVVNSAPCHSCKCHLEKCIKDYGLRRVYYST
jgi:deoxycytidylate deaminase